MNKKALYFIMLFIFSLLSIISYASYKISTPIKSNVFTISEIDDTRKLLKIEWAKYPKDENGVDIKSRQIINGLAFRDLVKSNYNDATEFCKSDLSYNDVINSKSYVDISEVRNSSTVLYREGNKLYWSSSYGNLIFNGNAAQMFDSLANLVTIDTTDWDTSNCYTMVNFFHFATGLQNIDLSNIDVSWVRDMSFMFSGTTFSTIDLTGWNTSRCENMFAMFQGCRSLTDISSIDTLDTRRVKNMSRMFNICSSLESLILPNMSYESCEDLSYFLANCVKLRRLSYQANDMNNVKTVAYMFENDVMLNSLHSYPQINLVSCEDFTGMTKGCSGITEIRFEYLKSYNAKTMKDMFSGLTSCTKILLPSDLDTSKCEDMSGMFMNCNVLEIANVDRLDTSNVKTLKQVFSGCNSVMSLDVSTWNTSNVEDFANVFFNCEKLTSLDVSNWNTSKATRFLETFYGCKSLEVLDVSRWNTSNVTDMYEVFTFMNNLKSIDVSNWDTSNVNRTGYMFAHCTSLTSLNLSSFDIRNVTDIRMMFCGSSSLRNIIYGSLFIPTSVICDPIYYDWYGYYDADAYVFANCPANRPDWSVYGTFDSDGTFTKY